MKNLREKYLKLKEEKENKKVKNDPKYLNFFDLPEGKTMTVRFLPDSATDDIFVEFAQHGGELKNSKIGKISCASTSSGQRCPACSHSYEFHKNGEKDEAKLWRRKETYIAQVVVIESPIEVPATEDGNPVKLFRMPFSIKDIIVESVINQTIEDPTANDFVIKKTVNKGGFADYSKSYFKTKESDIPESILSNENLSLYNLSDEIPEPATEKQVQAWLDNAIELHAEKTSDEENEEATQPAKKVAVQSKTTASAVAQPKESEEKQDQKQEQNAQGKTLSRSELMARLNARRA